MPSGTGYADLVYIPKKYDPSPTLIIELKAGGSPQEALQQIRSRNYASCLAESKIKPLLVAITYDKEDRSKPHYCMIEEL